MKLIIATIAVQADMNITDSDGRTIYDASNEGDVETVRLLIAAGADLNTANQFGYTSICIASHEGHVETVRLLIAAGADLNTANNEGITPIHAASDEGHVETVRLLIAAGTDLDEEAFSQLSVELKEAIRTERNWIRRKAFVIYGRQYVTGTDETSLMMSVLQIEGLFRHVAEYL